MRNKLKMVLCLSMLLIGGPLMAQELADSVSREPVRAQLKLQVKGYQDSIVLRWGLDNAAAWPFLRYAGLWIERAVLDEHNEITAENWERLNTHPVKPWTIDYFQQPGVLREDDDHLLVAAQALYGSLGVQVHSEQETDSLLFASRAYQNTFTMALMVADFSPKAADALGFRYVDRFKVNAKHKYTYRIFPADTHALFEIDTAYFMYLGFVKDEVYAPRMVQARGKDGAIEIFWPRKDLYNTYTSYNIERSDDGTHFSPLLDKPLVFSLTDTLQQDFVFSDSVANYRKYYYRINGVDAFGDTSYYCPTVSAMAVNLDAPPAAYLSGLLSTGGEVELHWVQTTRDERPIKGYVLRRGKSLTQLDEVAHEAILPPDVHRFKDKPTGLEEGLYYQLITIDTAGNIAFSNTPYVFAYDTIPPKAPEGLNGTIDSLGKVHLSWALDYGDNVYAYRLFMSNNPEHTFSPVSADVIRDTVFTDSVSRNLLNRKIYYKVLAIDGGNNQSAFSPVLELIRPKLVMSPAPVIGDFNVGRKGVSFTFSYAPDAEIKAMEVLRKEVADRVWTVLDTLQPEANSYLDTTALRAKTYQYALRSIDVFSNYSEESFPLQVFVYPVSKVAVSGLETVVENERVVLRWQEPLENIRFFLVYKDTGKGFIQYKSVDKNQFSFTEGLRGPVRYALKAMGQDTGTGDLVEGEWVGK